MEELLLTYPLIGWAATLLLVVLAILYLFSRIRKQDMETLREANDDLRKRDDDKTKEISEMKVQIQVLNTKVKALEEKNKTLEDLVVVALKQYFFENPRIASQLKGTFKR